MKFIFAQTSSPSNERFLSMGAYIITEEASLPTWGIELASLEDLLEFSRACGRRIIVSPVANIDSNEECFRNVAGRLSLHDAFVE